MLNINTLNELFIFFDNPWLVLPHDWFHPSLLYCRYPSSNKDFISRGYLVFQSFRCNMVDSYWVYYVFHFKLGVGVDGLFWENLMIQVACIFIWGFVFEKHRLSIFFQFQPFFTVCRLFDSARLKNRKKLVKVL